jgi:hypothetical protein
MPENGIALSPCRLLAGSAGSDVGITRSGKSRNGLSRFLEGDSQSKESGPQAFSSCIYVSRLTLRLVLRRSHE